MLIKRQELKCEDRGNAVSNCAPLPTDVWYNGSTYNFVWNYRNAYYAESEAMDVHLYYRENFAYKSIKSWNNITRTDGSLQVLVDDSWFLKPVPQGETNQTWTMYGYYLPSGTDAAKELGDTNSLLPTPFNFSAVQFADPNSIDTGESGSRSGGGVSHPSESESSSKDGLPGWSIGVIVVACVAFVVAVAAIIWGIVVFRRVRQRDQNNRPSVAPPHNPNVPPMADSDLANSGFRPHYYDGASIHSTTPITTTGLRASMNPRTSAGDTGYDVARPAQVHDFFSSRTSADDRFRHLLPNLDWGEALLQRELAEEGTSVKHAERRPLTVHKVPQPEISKIVTEHNDDS